MGSLTYTQNLLWQNLVSWLVICVSVTFHNLNTSPPGNICVIHPHDRCNRFSLQWESRSKDVQKCLTQLHSFLNMLSACWSVSNANVFLGRLNSVRKWLGFLVDSEFSGFEFIFCISATAKNFELKTKVFLGQEETRLYVFAINVISGGH